MEVMNQRFFAWVVPRLIESIRNEMLRRARIVDRVHSEKLEKWLKQNAQNAGKGILTMARQRGIS